MWSSREIQPTTTANLASKAKLWVLMLTLLHQPCLQLHFTQQTNTCAVLQCGSEAAPSSSQPWVLETRPQLSSSAVILFSNWGAQCCPCTWCSLAVIPSQWGPWAQKTWKLTVFWSCLSNPCVESNILSLVWMMQVIPAATYFSI